MCAAVVVVGKLKACSSTASSRAAGSTDTTIVATAPVSTMGVSSPPFKVAVRVVTWADAHIAENSSVAAAMAHTLSDFFMGIDSSDGRERPVGDRGEGDGAGT